MGAAERDPEAPSAPPPSDPRSAAAQEPTPEAGAQRFGLSAPEPVTRAIVWGTVVAGVGAAILGLLRVWIWISILEPIALGVVIGEVAAVPSSARHRRPPRWTYAYIFGLACLTYLLVLIAFWFASDGFPPSQSLLGFLQSAPSTTALPFLRNVDIARTIFSASAGATGLKYGLWIIEGLLMGASAAFAYRIGSVRKLRT